MKRTLSTLAFAIIVILLFIGAYLSWQHKGESSRSTEETSRARMMEDQVRGQMEKMGR